MPSSPASPEAVSVEHVRVLRGRLSLLIRMAPNAPRDVFPALLAAALRRWPSLPLHACVNEAGSAFGDVMDATSVPHLIEHLVIDEQARDASTPADLILTGTTEWLDKEGGLARVEVNFADDLAAFRALREALAFVNKEMVG